MDAHTRSLMTAPELALLERTEPKALEGLEHSDLAKLAVQLRKNADKYRQLYRKQERAVVQSDRSRAKTPVANERTAAKAAAFHDALSRVNRRLSALDREEASQLRAERLAMARAAKSGGPGAAGAKGTGKPAGAAKSKAAQRGPSGKAAATRSANARAQAKRDGK